MKCGSASQEYTSTERETPAAKSAFPFYTVNRKTKTATIHLIAKNGYIHYWKVPCDEKSTDIARNAIPFLKKIFPFEVTGARGRKKVTKNGISVAVAWMKIIHRTLDFPCAVRCRNHDWFDYTHNNIYVEWDDSAKQDLFERQTSYYGRLATAGAKEIVASQAEGQLTCDPSACSEEVRDIFREAQRLPARNVRPSGWGDDHQPRSGMSRMSQGFTMLNDENG